MPLQGVEAMRPHAAVGFEPGVDLNERFGTQLVPAPLGVPAHAHQAGLAQHAQVFGGAGLTQAEVLDELGDGSRPFAEQIQDVTPSGLGEGGEGGGHRTIIAVWLYNHQEMFAARASISHFGVHLTLA